MMHAKSSPPVHKHISTPIRQLRHNTHKLKFATLQPFHSGAEKRSELRHLDIVIEHEQLQTAQSSRSLEGSSSRL